MHNLANWLNEIINELRIEYFYFLSHSWGSFVALFYLLNYPEKVQGSILIDGGYQTKRLREETLEEELIMKRTLMNTFLIIGTNFSKVKRSLY